MQSPDIYKHGSGRNWITKEFNKQTCHLHQDIGSGTSTLTKFPDVLNSDYKEPIYKQDKFLPSINVNKDESEKEGDLEENIEAVHSLPSILVDNYVQNSLQAYSDKSENKEEFSKIDIGNILKSTSTPSCLPLKVQREGPNHDKEKSYKTLYDEQNNQNETWNSSNYDNVTNSIDQKLLEIHPDFHYKKKLTPPVQRSLSDSSVNRRNSRSSEEVLKRRKSVHFADTSGQELEIHIPIRHSDEYDVPPRLMEALKKIQGKLNDEVESPLIKEGIGSLQQYYTLVLGFQQPFLQPTFQSRVSQQNVCLENISILPNSLSFSGVVRVANLEYEKRVTVRFTTDNWKSCDDIPAHFMTSFDESRQDQFTFQVQVRSERISSGCFVEMAIRYFLPQSNRNFWDNNFRRNYVIKCLEYRGNSGDEAVMT